MKQYDYKTDALKFYRKIFHKLVHQQGYVNARKHMESVYNNMGVYGYKWGHLENEIFQWYDFEILGVTNG